MKENMASSWASGVIFSQRVNGFVRAMVMVGGVLLLAGCNDSVTRVEFDALQKEAVGLRASLEELTERSAAELSELEEQLGEQSGERDRLEGENEVLKQQLEDSKQEREKLKADYEDYRRKYRVSVREKAPGRRFERVAVAGEKEEVFTGVVIREINPVRIRVMHDAGATTLHLANLSKEMQAELAFDLEEATEFLEAEEKAEEPEVLTKEEENQRTRDRLARDRMKNQAAWEKNYSQAQKIKREMSEVAAKQRAVLAALNRYYARTRSPGGSNLKNINRLKAERSKLDRQYQELKMKHHKLLNG